MANHIGLDADRPDRGGVRQLHGAVPDPGAVQHASDIVVYKGVRYEYRRPNFLRDQADGRYQCPVVSAGLAAAWTSRTAGRRRGAPAHARRSSTAPSGGSACGLSYNLDELSVSGGRLCRANLSQLKPVYHLNVRTFVRAILSTRTSRATPGSIPPHRRRTRRLFCSTVLVQAQPADGALRRLLGQPGGDQSNDLQRQNRTFFIKLGYAWIM